MTFKKQVAIDLGTANTLVYIAGKGIVLNEPTVVAYSVENNQILAVGEDARQMLGRTPGNIIASRPLKDGVIADYTITEAMVSYFIKKAVKQTVFRIDLMISVPGGSTQVEKRAVVSACKSAGASDVYLIEEPLAAAIGAQIPISQASGHMIVNIGGGTAEIAVISLGQLVVYRSIRGAGTKIDEAIIQYLRKQYNLIIGERTAEDVKIKIGNAYLDSALESKTTEVKGRDFQTGLPKIINVTEKAISEAIQKPLKGILDGVKEVLAQTPPELASDIVDRGIVISGGTGLLNNIDKYFTFNIGVAALIAEEPLFCVIRGAGMAIENLESYKEAIR
ncbi:rod shape-determining protein [Candidatus Roizmanbacteria bacterium RIFCSPLOWO2_02_FULL_37_19]|uniref:Cell shape-determining protein MreB n=1 Tax=Candidatus Roizmanbacteria bacterium RIFCSPHIGHO2_02_FULL_37_24 TaxID=1802037 RepID=A0A1F7GVN8_9BACT|nr:MAG: rod shape-determining protein [Candidatus Roizmanbacteria bacterium RIFCSPHIGHO2_01_FULL_38_41]OGK23120.1 MAG: rod shape-determining protein [Candidatus Roizmanbacteria bacterium RIFCSPHIGHO2_02_FULL_37_24]OGK32843.1 MAG: rod shape-determining protein [Candidatus Roizmanbacteria bacterium RIFCSPHIGHO2_12_FULL_37_23]OGK45480.1 MAG: rod shape-determining protein [Candidatus Roizmanbacteria bacterium RIFCSPLOWO2_01_FULL_37_57]OGK54256.1 MAG: rod shape-determining protein [Candidatus Roizma